jgi:DNA-binding GntR family transcriptional regulator
MTEAVLKAYAVIRDRISDGSFASGERMVERKLCDIVGVSRTPVREALRRLAAEGLLVVDGRGGMLVAQTTTDAMGEIFGLSALLEGYGARLAAAKADDGHIEQLRRINEEMKGQVARLGDLEADEALAVRTRLAQLDDSFHHTVATGARNGRLCGLLRQVMGVTVLLQAYQRYRVAEIERSIRQHSEIIDALVARDGDRAEAAMRIHVLTARTSSLNPGH